MRRIDMQHVQMRHAKSSIKEKLRTENGEKMVSESTKEAVLHYAVILRIDGKLTNRFDFGFRGVVCDGAGVCDTSGGTSIFATKDSRPGSLHPGQGQFTSVNECM